MRRRILVKQIAESFKLCRKIGITTEADFIIGHPFETGEKVLKIMNLARDLFKKDWVDTLQAAVVIPYLGTPLFEECKKNDWLKTLDWDRYDMKEPVMKTSMTDEEIMTLVRGIYGSFWSGEFIWLG